MGSPHIHNHRAVLSQAAHRWERVENLVAIDPATGTKRKLWLLTLVPNPCRPSPPPARSPSIRRCAVVSYGAR